MRLSPWPGGSTAGLVKTIYIRVLHVTGGRFCRRIMHSGACRLQQHHEAIFFLGITIWKRGHGRGAQVSPAGVARNTLVTVRHTCKLEWWQVLGWRVKRQAEVGQSVKGVGIEVRRDGQSRDGWFVPGDGGSSAPGVPQPNTTLKPASVSGTAPACLLRILTGPPFCRPGYVCRSALHDHACAAIREALALRWTRRPASTSGNSAPLQ